MQNRIIVIGAGGHAKVVAEAILKQQKYDLLGFADDSLQLGTKVIGEFKVLCSVDQIDNINFEYFVVAIGNNAIRKKIFIHLQSKYSPATIIHPFTSVSDSALIEDGSVVLPGAVLACCVRIGSNCIIGSNVHIDHESIVEAHSYLRSGTNIGSNSKIDSLSSTTTGQNIQSFSHYTTE